MAKFGPFSKEEDSVPPLCRFQKRPAFKSDGKGEIYSNINTCRKGSVCLDTGKYSSGEAGRE